MPWKPFFKLNFGPGRDRIDRIYQEGGIMQQRPTRAVLSMLVLLSLIGGHPSDTFPMGRSGPLAVDDSLPETLTPRDNRSAQGSAIFLVGVSMSGNSKKALMTSGTVVGAYNNGKSRVLIVVNAPKDGWYIINCATAGAGAQASLTSTAPISLGGGSPPAPVTVATWDYRSRPPGTHVYPALVELKAGSHWFYWTLESGSVEFLETHILKAKIEG
jgi:hypothetical protein